MKDMTEFEIRANNIVAAIINARSTIEDFGDDADPAKESVSRIYGMFVTWLIACEEARHQRANFSQSVIAALPDEDDPNWRTYISPGPVSTLKKRAESLWGIRVAFTHGDGDMSLITNQANKIYAADACHHLPGVSIENNRLVVIGAIENTAIRTMVQLRDVLL